MPKIPEGYEEWRRARNHRRAPPPRERRDQDIDGLGRVKVKFPAFEGKCDPDAYMDWETKIEQIWSCHDFSEPRKVQLAALEFNGFALTWWDHIVKERQRNLDPPVQSWEQIDRKSVV